ncbi:hypothetical protein SARC_07780 [Sphaeroforma arctica JP610]|uniref:Agd3 deacetylase domain-containing protein n=1 Tax=Sphaeroforma arctica JP610 TaxID=667725 RepID=A0A0L0FSR0_9EUKA|nr:hypothetical protein SARC_07780 [Sphaeroforma arctica JP610]KNC79842.1 hypothetical protein SARC_07780 [Sphaeroforma arctica JP610]|eukprot:XP_014153744.1 hypothetical protein SARC_07780 [Sphaeroforma arctica JP610]
MNMHLPTGSNYTAEPPLFDGSDCGSRVEDAMADIAAAFVWVTASTDLEVDESTIERIRETANSVFRESKHAETSWSPLAFIIPSADGLNYTSTIDDILRMGYRNTVGDDLLQGYSCSSPWHSQTPSGLRDENGNVLKGVDAEAFQKRMHDKYGTSSVTIVPRLTTRIYHGVSTPRQLVRKLNGAVYRRKDRHNYEDIMKLEGFEVARNMLSFRREPYEFHPANLEQFKAGTSLLQEWVNSALAAVKAYTNFPIYTYKMDDFAELYRQLESRDLCQIKGTIQYLEGRPVALEVTSQSECDTKVTYTDTDGAYDFQPQQNDRRRGVSDASGDAVSTLKLAGDGSSHTVRLSGAEDIETVPTVNTSTEDGTELEAEDSGDRALTPSISLDTVVSDRGSTTRATPMVLSPTTALGLTSQTPTVPSGGQGNTVSTSTTIDAASNSGRRTSQSLSADEGIAISSSQASEFSVPATTFTLSSTTATGTATTKTWASTSTITQTETGAGLSGPIGTSNGGQSLSSDEAVAMATGVSSDTQSERVSDTVSSEPLSTSANNPIGADSAEPVSTQTLLFPSVTDASPTAAGASASSGTSPTSEVTTSRIIDLPVASDAETSTSSPGPSSEARSGSGSGSGSGSTLVANSSAGTLTGAAIAGLVIGVLLVLTAEQQARIAGVKGSHERYTRIRFRTFRALRDIRPPHSVSKMPCEA